MYAQDIDLMSFNIRYDSPNDGLDQWAERKSEVYGLISNQDPHVIGLQEALYSQLTYLDSLLIDYAFVGLGRDDGDKKGEFSPILYDSTRLSLMDHGTFWLSPSPEKVSVGWDAALPRVCTYAILKEINSEKIFWVYNTHFDHVGATARLSSAATIVQHIYKNNISAAPIILMGDLNALPQSKPLELLNNHFTDPLKGSSEGTFWGFDIEAKAENRIDYILGKQVSFQEAKILKNLRSNGRHISDHLPVLVKISLD
jgi:endonuclease/exonuclease/phosphatase family metal-dependent hydrolase